MLFFCVSDDIIIIICNNDCDNGQKTIVVKTVYI